MTVLFKDRLQLVLWTSWCFLQDELIDWRHGKQRKSWWGTFPLGYLCYLRQNMAMFIYMLCGTWKTTYPCTPCAKCYLHENFWLLGKHPDNLVYNFKKDDHRFRAIFRAFSTSDCHSSKQNSMLLVLETFL